MDMLVEIVRNADKAQQQKNPELSDENRIRAYIAEHTDDKILAQL